MVSLSSTYNIYNPNSNRLVPTDSAAGRNALKLLDLNSVFINYCGKNEAWLPESLRAEGVKITKVLSEETRKELKCDTVQDLNHKYGKKTSVKIALSKDNTILSKKFSKIQSQHKKSVNENTKIMKERQKRRAQKEQKDAKQKVKDFNNTKLFYQHLIDLSVTKRLTFIQNIVKSKANKDSLVKMLLITLVNYKEKKVTSKSQRDNKALVVDKLTKGLNEAGNQISQKLSNYDATDIIYSATVSLDDTLDKKLDNLLVEILGSSEAVDALYMNCCS
jgi:hypothetical protein